MRFSHPSRATGQSDGASPYVLWLIWVFWLLFLAQPLSAIFAQPSSPRKALAIVVMAAFITLYLWATWQEAFRLTRETPMREEQPWLFWAPIGLMLAIGVVLSLLQGVTALGTLIYVSAALCGRLTAWRAALAVGAMTLFATAVGVLSGAPISAFGQILIIIPAVGSFVYFLSRAVRTNQELRRARQEIARLAVSDERLRFARDLHDLLGHTLSLIALKSELARRLVSASPEQAATEIGDIETAARQALVEVREAVTGYRRATLENELNAAQELLAAAGIAFTQQGEPPPLTSSAKAALAWAVREGVTNVIRHSQARSCGVTLTRRGAAIALEVRDDGAASHDAAGGSGLAGLKERFAALGGSCEAGPAQGGGWRLAVSLPLGAEAAVTAATAPSGEKKVTPWFG